MEHTPESLARLKRYMRSLATERAAIDKDYQNCTILGQFMKAEMKSELDYIAAIHSLLALTISPSESFKTAFLTGLGLGMDFMEQDLLESMVKEERKEN